MSGVPAVKSYLPFIVAGITSGSVYGLAAVGLVLTYRTSGIFNFAHGAQAALAAYVMFELRERVGLPWPVAGLLTLLLAGVLAGLLLERLASGLAQVSMAARVAATVGLLVGLQGGLVVVFGSASIPMRAYLPQRILHFWGVNVRVEQLIITLVALVAIVSLYLFLNRARVGLAMQALVDDPALLGLAGTSPVAVRRFAWLIGSSFAAASGMLLAPTITLDAGILTLLVFFAFGAAAVGRFSSLPGTYLGGLGLGVIAAILTKLVGDHHVTGPLASVPPNMSFVVLFVALVMTPKGTLIERGVETVRRPGPPASFRRSTRIVGSALGAAVAVTLPHVAGTRLPLYTTALAYVVLFASLSLLVRGSGQLSLCHITFAAVGAGVAARAVGAGVPWLVAVVMGGLVAAPIGALVAIPAIRLSGVFLAIATFGFGLVVQRVFYPSVLMFGREFALTAPRPEVGRLSGDVGYYYVVLATTVACLGLVAFVRRSRLGRLLRAFADSAVAVDALGTNTNELKVLVFGIGAFVAGVAGALIGPVTGKATVGSFDFSVSLLLVAVLFIAGRQPLLSAVVAAGLYVVGPGYISSASLRAYTPVLFGALAVAAALLSGVSLRGWFGRSARLQARAAEDTPLQRRHSIPVVATGAEPGSDVPGSSISLSRNGAGHHQPCEPV